MGREDGLHFSASQISSSSRSYLVFQIFFWYQELFNLFLFILKRIQNCRWEHLLVLYLSRLFFYVISLRFCRMFYSIPAAYLLQWGCRMDQDLPQSGSDFAVVISECCDLLVLCRKESTILLHQWWNSLEKWENWVCLCGIYSWKAGC